MRVYLVGVLAALCLFLLFVGIDQAGAATYVQSCPSPSAYTSEPAVVEAQTCAVESERLEAIETQLETGPPLASGDRQSLDLVWVGVFLSAGLGVGGVVGSWMHREQKGWGGGA